MSSDTNPDVPPRIRCEAVSSSTSLKLACHRSHGSVLRYPGTSRVSTPADDPAFLIGLALGHVRQSDGLTDSVPNTLVDRLQAHADTGNPACRLLLDWLERRNSNLLALSLPSPVKPLQVQHRPGRRMITERRQAGPGSLKKRGLTKAGASDPKTAIIAAQPEGQGDE